MKKIARVSSSIISAVKFVIGNLGDCILRALPILFLISLVAYFRPLLGENFGFIANLIEPFLYAMFAVSWHRYTVLEKERLRRGFPYQFGWREIKFGALSVATAMLTTAILATLLKTLPQELALLAFFAILIPFLLMVVFIYPAIALDQPLRLKRFLSEGFWLLPSFLVATIFICVCLAVIGGGGYLLLGLLAKVFTPDALQILIFFLVNLVFTPILLAITASTASFLYRDVIGLEETTD